MRAIAAEARVQPAAIYHHYASKEDILVGLQDDFMQRLTEQVVAALEQHERPALRLAAAVHAHVVFHGLHTRAAFVTDSEIRALNEARRAALIAKRDDYERMFSGMIRDGIRDGSLRTSDVHVATYAILLQCTGVALWFDPRGPLALEEVAELHVELVLGSLQASRELIAEAIESAGGWGRRHEPRAIKPPALPEAATIAVVAPASPPQTRSEIEQATAYFEARGHQVVLGPNPRKVHGYLAGTDEERAVDLQWALSEPGIDMVHTLCGGYGTARLHDRIDWGALGEPRIVCGFSDITALHLALAAHAGWVTFYGPNFVRFTRRKDELTDETKQWFHRAFQPEPLGRVFEDPEDPYVLTVGEGVAEAPLVGGCLTLLCASIGTPVRGADRRLHPDGRGPQHRRVPGRHGAQPPDPRRQARQRGRLRVRDEREPAAQTIPEGSESTLSIEEVLDELIAPLGIPAIANVPVGHGKHMATMPLGATAGRRRRARPWR